MSDMFKFSEIFGVPIRPNKDNSYTEKTFKGVH